MGIVAREQYSPVLSTDLIAPPLLRKMNFVGTVSRLRTGVNQGWKIKSFGSSKFLTRSNNSQHFRRTLINSTETGGILPKKAPIRMGWNYKLPALAIGAGLIAVDLKCFLDEDSLNEFFGVAWNWGMIATIITLPTAWCLLWVILSATLPAITLPF